MASLHKAENFRPQHLLAALSQIGINSHSLIIDGQFQGGQCRIFKLSFDDHASISIRTPHLVDEADQEDMIATMQMEIHTFEKLEARGFCWSPKYLGASLTFKNPIGVPFIVLTWAEGEPLRMDDASLSRPLRNKILSQLALIQLSLIECTQEIRQF